jgi:hypothetical protein
MTAMRTMILQIDSILTNWAENIPCRAPAPEELFPRIRHPAASPAYAPIRRWTAVRLVPQLIRLRVSKRIFATLCRNNRIEALKGRLKFSELDHFLFEFRRKRIVAILGLR